VLPRGAGAILNVSSRQGKDGTAGHADYSAAKWGLIGFTQALAREVGPHGIRVNAICPGPTLTEGMIRGFAERAQYSGMAYDAVVAWSADQAALRRLTQPEEFAAVALFLCSDGAKAMTGQAINVTSGRWLG
jgi:NAD(P)-dependent dehydrogenase (short-subunit alcohol dehydrogenase family)